jgi:hypothetical protein
MAPPKLTTEQFIAKVALIHNFYYDYSKTFYKGSNQTVEIICPKHGLFTQVASAHALGKGCRRCAQISCTIDLITECVERRGSILFDYSKIEFKSSRTPIEIICKKHNTSFFKRMDGFFAGENCPICTKEIPKTYELKYNTDEFIKIANELHNFKYGYDKVIYRGSGNLIEIFCFGHFGYFQQKPEKHLQKHGCNICVYGKEGKTHSKFIEECKLIHGNKYEYLHTLYKKDNEFIIISCPKHGLFHQLASNHLQGQGCPKCAVVVSKGEIAWLDYLNIDSAFRHKCKIINSRKFNLDAIDEENKMNFMGIIGTEILKNTLLIC